MIRSVTLSVLALFILGCSTTNTPHSEFVSTVNFSAFDTFSYKHTMCMGMDWTDTDEMILEDLSEEVIARELAARGFANATQGSDFYVVTKWKKAASAYPSPFHSINGPQESFRQHDDPTYRFAARVHLTVEVYVTDTQKIFWRKDLPNIFDAVEFTEERIVASLERAIKNFPTRVEKDPALPNIE